MRGFRVAFGALLLVVVSGGVLAGVWMLRQSGGGGLQVSVEFADADGLDADDDGLDADDDVIFGDQIVGRVEDVTKNDGRFIVQARIASDHADLLREGSRFWIEETLSGAVLFFDTPVGSGRNATSGRRFDGLSSRPELAPENAPLQAPRTLDNPPSWLCEVRVALDLANGTEFGETQRRKGAGAVVEKLPDGDVLILAPSWIAQYSGALLDESFRVEFTGGATMVAEPLKIRLPFMVLVVRDANYAGEVARLWAQPVANEQALILTDFDGRALTGVHYDGSVELKAKVGQGLIALIDGANVAGFAIPPVGLKYGVTWAPLNGAGIAVDEAQAKLNQDE